MLLYVVHHAVQAPLRPDIRLPAMVQAAQAFVVPQVCKHRLHGADALGVQLPASRGIGGLAYAFAGGGCDCGPKAPSPRCWLRLSAATASRSGYCSCETESGG